MTADLRAHLEDKFGVQSGELYWKIFEDLRKELGYADYLGALQRYRSVAPGDPDLLLMSDYLIDYPFADRLYPGALAALETARAAGPTVILSDGDVVFQPRKIRRSGIWDAVEGRVLIYVHKEAMLEDMQARYPALRYVMVDDKLRILAAMKQVLGERLFTVFPRQGHYARDAAAIAGYPAADLTIGSIGELARWDWPSSLSGAR